MHSNLTFRTSFTWLSWIDWHPFYPIVFGKRSNREVVQRQLCHTAATCAKYVNQDLAKPPLKFNDGSAECRLTFYGNMMKSLQGVCRRVSCLCSVLDKYDDGQHGYVLVFPLHVATDLSIIKPNEIFHRPAELFYILLAAYKTGTPWYNDHLTFYPAPGLVIKHNLMLLLILTQGVCDFYNMIESTNGNRNMRYLMWVYMKKGERLQQRKRWRNTKQYCTYELFTLSTVFEDI